MTQKELQYSIARFLGWNILPDTDNECFTRNDTWDIWHLDDFDLNNWNFLMEVVEAIEKLKYLVVIQSNFCQIQEIGTKENNFKPLIIASLYGKDKKEAVVEAISQFLSWYYK